MQQTATTFFIMHSVLTHAVNSPGVVEKSAETTLEGWTTQHVSAIFHTLQKIIVISAFLKIQLSNRWIIPHVFPHSEAASRCRNFPETFQHSANSSH